MDIKSLLETIELIHKRKDIIKILLDKQIKFYVYNLNDDKQYLEIKQYENIIGNMMKQCFDTKEFTIKQYVNVIWVIGKLENKIVTALMIHLKGKYDSPWLWSICRDEKYREYGFGKQLIKFTLEYIRTAYPQKKQVYLYAAQKPIPRTSYYESLGFQKTGKFDEDDPEMMFNFQ